MKFKVVTGYDGDCPYRDIVESNLREYCNKWRYDLVARFDGWGESDGVKFWRKQEMIFDAFSPDCDWLVWLDADCMIMNMGEPLEHLVCGPYDLVVSEQRMPCEICRIPVFSAGVILFRSCEWAENQVRKWMASETATWRTGRYSQCEQHTDQEYFCHSFMGAPEVCRRTRLLGAKSVCNFEPQFTDGTFLLHFPGHTPNQKADIMRRMVDRVVRPGWWGLPQFAD